MGQSPVTHPLAPPTLSGNTISVDMMLNSPTRITRMIMDLTMQKFVLDRFFASAGGVTGGAIVYDQATENELYLDRDVQKVAPGGEFPLVTSERLAPRVAEVEKWGGKVFITDEAKRRNNSVLFTNQMRQLSNTIVRKLNQRAIDEVEDAITEHSQTMTGVDWSSVVVGGSSQSNSDEFPARDFRVAQQLAEEMELGVEYDTWILNPQEMTSLFLAYGNANLQALLQALKLNIFVTNRVAAGEAYVCAAGQVGEMRLEEPLQTETWRDPEGKQQTWVQSFVLPVFAVTNPFAVLKVTGLAG